MVKNLPSLIYFKILPKEIMQKQLTSIYYSIILCVFLNETHDNLIGLEVAGMFKESEGLTLIIPEGQALAKGLDIGFRLVYFILKCLLSPETPRFRSHGF